MIVEYNAVLPPQNKRFKCNSCGSQWIAEGEGDEWFIKPSKYIDGTEQYISYCPICGAEARLYSCS